MHHCYHKLHGDTWKCQTTDTRIFFCTCGSELEYGDRFKGDRFLHAFYIHPHHKAHELPDGSDYEEYPDYVIGGQETEKEEMKVPVQTNDPVQIENLEHFYQHCSKSGYLPLACTVSKTYKPELTTCECAGELLSIGHTHSFFFNTSGMWNHFPCKITADYTLLLKTQAKTSILTLFLSLLIFLILAFIAIFSILKIRNRMFRRYDDQMVMSLLPD